MFYLCIISHSVKEARGKLAAQAKKLLDRQEKVEDSLKRGKESESLKKEKVSESLKRGKECQPREQERGRRGRAEARSQSSDPANRNPAESDRYC